MNSELIKELYNFIKKADQFLNGDMALLDLISSVWDVYQKPSTGEDYRYKVLGDEINKHYFQNDDWPTDKLYINILKILDDEVKLMTFITGLINLHKIRSNKQLMVELESILYLNNMNIVDKNGTLQIQESDDPEIQKEQSDIPFILCSSKIRMYSTFGEADVHIPNIDKCFVVTFNDEWNDYSYKTWFRIYYKNEESINEIGRVKIMKRGELNTKDTLPQQFTYLGNDYCSLGYELEYYSNMYKLFEEKAPLYLNALKDVAINQKLHDIFSIDIPENRAFYTSLLRANTSERALREGKFYARGMKIGDAYSFGIKFKPPYDRSDNGKLVYRFDFNYQCPSQKRIIGLIGENGVGKSSLLEKICSGIAYHKSDEFEGNAPIFSKVMMVSYSPFDIFPTHLDNCTIEYRYNGLFASENELIKRENQIEVFKSNLKEILKREHVDSLLEIWKNIMSEVIKEEVITSFYHKNNGEYELCNETIDSFCMCMSSGESIFVYALTEIIANIRFDSLIIFDEPEQHLHPHAIMALVRAITNVLTKFQSYAIIATHSPLVVRELMSDNVFVFKRTEDSLYAAKIGIECFGEDISVLTDVVFGNLNEDKTYEHIVNEIVKSCNYDYEKALNEIRGEHNELSLDLKMLVRTIINNNAKL